MSSASHHTFLLLLCLLSLSLAYRKNSFNKKHRMDVWVGFLSKDWNCVHVVLWFCLLVIKIQSPVIPIQLWLCFNKDSQWHSSVILSLISFSKRCFQDINGAEEWSEAGDTQWSLTRHRKLNCSSIPRINYFLVHWFVPPKKISKSGHWSLKS